MSTRRRRFSTRHTTDMLTAISSYLWTSVSKGAYLLVHRRPCGDPSRRDYSFSFQERKPGVCARLQVHIVQYQFNAAQLSSTCTCKESCCRLPNNDGSSSASAGGTLQHCQRTLTAISVCLVSFFLHLLP
jgi:hypothetical protein